jgi:hypothetical protein
MAALQDDVSSLGGTERAHRPASISSSTKKHPQQCNTSGYTLREGPVGLQCVRNSRVPVTDFT